MTDFEAKDYSLFDKGASTIESSKEKLNTMLQNANTELSNIYNNNLLSGKAADSLVEAWQEDIGGILEDVADLTNFSNYLKDTATEYAKTDNEVGANIDGV